MLAKTREKRNHAVASGAGAACARSPPALEDSRAENTSTSTHELKLKINELFPVFGDRSAEEITRQELVC
jgi:hypothetical protein